MLAGKEAILRPARDFGGPTCPPGTVMNCRQTRTVRFSRSRSSRVQCCDLTPAKGRERREQHQRPPTVGHQLDQLVHLRTGWNDRC